MQATGKLAETDPVQSAAATPTAGRGPVLFVLPSFGRSGAVDFVIDLADALAGPACPVEILVLNGDTVPNRLPGSGVTISVAGNDDPDQGNRRQRIGRHMRSSRVIGKLVRSIARSSVVMSTWEMGRALTLPTIIASLLRRPVITVVQNNIQRSLADYRSPASERLLRWSYGRARAVVCVSDALARVVDDFGGRRWNVVSIPNGINVQRVRALAGERANADLPADGLPYVVGVGRLAPQKGFDLLIRAHAACLERAAAHRLVLIGHGPEKDALRALAKSLGVRDSVNFLGFMANPYPVLARSSVLCASSRYEGRSLVLAEALALGVPVIATDCPTGPREVLAGGRYGELVEPDSVEALAGAIERHLGNPGRLRVMVRKARDMTKAVSIERCAEQYRALIAEML